MTAPVKQPSESQVLTTKWAVSVPMLVIVVSVVATNLGMYYSMEGRTTVLDTKVETIQESVAAIQASVATLTATTTTEMKALRKEVTDLRVELATVRATMPK